MFRFVTVSLTGFFFIITCGSSIDNPESPLKKPAFSQSTPPSLGDGSSGNPYQLSTLGNLYWITEDSLRCGYHYIQTADINAAKTKKQYNDPFDGPSDSGWTPIRNFKGTFNGKGHRIDSLFIDRNYIFNIGLFGCTSGAQLDSIVLTNLNINSGGNSFIGGLVGINSDNSTINHCYSGGTVSTNGRYYGSVGGIGGLIGYNRNKSTVDKCYSNCIVNALSSYGSAGGLVGANSYNSTISNCFSSGAVSGKGSDGGIGGIGGLVGCNDNSSTVSNCFSNGSVNGYSKVGGLVGENYNSTVINCYSSGSVSGSSIVGGLVGQSANYSKVHNSFWDVEHSGQSESASGTGKTTAQMKIISTYTSEGWDFIGESANGLKDIWEINSEDNSGYPFLKF
jgi:hypothetical protein